MPMDAGGEVDHIFATLERGRLGRELKGGAGWQGRLWRLWAATAGTV
jgi:hypothetical protein